MKRHSLDALNRWKKRASRKPLIVRGARQVGKTYLLKAFGQGDFPAVHHVDFEKERSLGTIFEGDLQPLRIIKALNFHLQMPIDVTRDLVIFDEIQQCPRALTSLKYFAEELPGLALCAAGSLLGIHLHEASFPVGKVEYLDLYPMSFDEFLLASGENDIWELLHHLTSTDIIPDTAHARLWEQWKIYGVVGGLPEMVQTYIEHKDDLFRGLQIVRKRQTDLIATYHADMAKHSGKTNAMHIERLWSNIPAQLAREQNGSTPKFTFKGVLPGIKSYARCAGVIDWLQAAGLLMKVPIVHRGELPFAAYVKENRFKLYLFDVGILGAMSGLPPATILNYDYGSYKGYFAENVVAQEFCTAGAHNLHCWRGRTAEVEFLREIGGVVIPIEVKSGWVTKAKSLSVFAQQYRPPYRVIFSGHNLELDRQQGLHRYPLYVAGRFPLER